MFIKKLVFLPTLLLLFVLAGCGLDKADKKKAESIPTSIENIKKDITSQKKAFEDLKKSGDWKFLKTYAEAEKWSEYFVQATQLLTVAEGNYKNTILPLLKKNDSDDKNKFKRLVREEFKRLTEVKQLASKSNDRKVFFLKAKKESKEWIKTATPQASEIRKLVAKAKQTASKAKSDYPEKVSDINKRFAAIKKLESDSNAALKVAKAELAKVSSGIPDYAKLRASTDSISSNLDKMKAKEQALKSKLDELYKSYSKILIDMKVEYFVKIGRASWDSYSDWDNSDDYYYTRQVSTAVFEVLESSEGTIATHRRENISSNIWNSLRINKKESWCCGDDEAEFWVDQAFTKTYHKYTIIENGVKKDTAWEEVNNSTFEAHEDNLGLTILSKPYGKYEDEVIKSAAPPGMEYIAKPTMNGNRATGKNQYGEWKQDSSGNSFWHYYGQYAFISHMFGPSYHYGYNDYYGYSNRGSGHYYGSNDQYGTYWSRTYGKKSRFSRSNYVDKNPNVRKEARASRSRTNKTQHASVRGAGSKSRGRGPSGGGK